MRPVSRKALRVGVPVVAAAALAGVLVPTFASSSSHREAPAISQDPTVDSTDVYAFRSPDRPDTATIIANYVPFQEPAGGPNFYRFSDDALYDVVVDNNGDAGGDVVYRFRFTTKTNTPGSFLYNTGPVAYDSSARRYVNLNLEQRYTVTKLTRTKSGKFVSRVVGRNLLTPPNNVGPKSTPDYDALAAPAVQQLSDGTKVFAGQRDDPFYVDLGSIFDLVNFRIAPPAAFSEGGVDGLRGYGVNTIALQVPIKNVTRNRTVPTDTNSPASVVGVYTRALRPKVEFGKGRTPKVAYTQVSRLAEPLVNEVLIPLGKKDEWNRSDPWKDAQYEKHYLQPELAGALNAFFDLGSPTTNRVDLTTVLLKGIPPSNGLGLPTTQIGSNPKTADLLRVNLAVPPTPFAQQDRLGLLAGQADGFPNGRRLVDDVVDIEERAVGGVLAAAFGLPAPNGSNAALVPSLGDGVNANDKAFTESFPYMPAVDSGFDSVPHP